MDSVSDKKYFCINCFEDENIKDFIRNNGKPIKNELFQCGNCQFETYNEADLEDCIQEYINDCIEQIQKNTTDEDYENNENTYELKCKEECNAKYKQTCINKIANETFIIKQEILTNKLQEVVNKLYEHDDEHGFYGSASSNNWTEGVDCPCNIAGLYSTDEICGDIFGNDGEKISEFLNEIYDFHECPWLCRCFDDKNEYKLESWDDFCNHTKHTARYFDHTNTKLNVTKTLNDFNTFFKELVCEDYSLSIYRARKIKDLETKQKIIHNPQSELGKASPEKAKHNRFSPIGISYGYYAFDRDTALNEIRTRNNDEIAIGEFELDSKLKIIDFNKEDLKKYLNPFLETFNINFYCESIMIRHFIDDISKPIKENDSLLEYVPTQIVAEYIWSQGYDGFIFDSSQNKDGKNIVLFGDNPQYKDYKIVKIQNIDYKYD